MHALDHRGAIQGQVHRLPHLHVVEGLGVRIDEDVVRDLLAHLGEHHLRHGLLQRLVDGLRGLAREGHIHLARLQGGRA